MNAIHIPSDLWNGIIRDFRIDLVRNDIFHKVKAEFKNKVEFDILSLRYHETELWVCNILNTIKYYEQCPEFHGVYSSLQLCIRDLCEFIDEHHDMLSMLYYHDNCPDHIRYLIEDIYDYYDECEL